MPVATVLIVVDSHLLCSVMGRLLQQQGCEVLKSTSAATALHVLAERPPDAILLDIDLPDGEGVTFCEQSRAMAFQGPIILLGYHAHRVGALLDATLTIEKPFDPLEAVGSLQPILDKLVIAKRV